MKYAGPNALETLFNLILGYYQFGGNLPNANKSIRGLMSAADKRKLDSLSASSGGGSGGSIREIKVVSTGDDNIYIATSGSFLDEYSNVKPGDMVKIYMDDETTIAGFVCTITSEQVLMPGAPAMINFVIGGGLYGFYVVVYTSNYGSYPEQVACQMYSLPSPEDISDLQSRLLAVEKKLGLK